MRAIRRDAVASQVSRNLAGGLGKPPFGSPYPGFSGRRRPSTMPSGTMGHRQRALSCRKTGIRDRMGTICWILSTRVGGARNLDRVHAPSRETRWACQIGRKGLPNRLLVLLCFTVSRGSIRASLPALRDGWKQPWKASAGRPRRRLIHPCTSPDKL